MSAVRRGTEAERRVAHHLRNQGWLVASRRRLGGAGDILAFKPGHLPRLVEVKAGPTPYANFPPADREAMKATAENFKLDALLAWCPAPSKPIAWRTVEDWP